MCPTSRSGGTALGDRRARIRDRGVGHAQQRRLGACGHRERVVAPGLDKAEARRLRRPGESAAETATADQRHARQRLGPGVRAGGFG